MFQNFLGGGPDPPSAGMLCMPVCFAYYECKYVSQPYINNDDRSGCAPLFKSLDLPLFVLSAIACPLIVHSIDCAIELVATNYQTPAVFNCKNISKCKMNPHKHKYTLQLMNTLSRVELSHTLLSYCSYIYVASFNLTEHLRQCVCVYTRSYTLLQHRILSPN